MSLPVIESKLTASFHSNYHKKQGVPPVDNQIISTALVPTMTPAGKARKDKKRTTRSGLDTKTGMVESVFTKTLRATVKEQWPTKELHKDPARVRDQLVEMFGALFDRLELKAELGRGAKGSALRIVSDMLKDSEWPKTDMRFKVPRQWSEKRLRAFRRYEVCCAMAIFYRAYHKTCTMMSSPTDWPPKS